jgi:hypothetical protein
MEEATFHGRYFHVEDAILEPKPDHAAHTQRGERRGKR